MELNYERIGELQVITPQQERIDAAVAIKFKDEMRKLTADGPETVILDLESVSFIDSSGLGAIVGAMKQLGAGQTLQLAGLSPNVEKVFRLTRMDRVFRIYMSRDEALGSVAAAT
ncbi:MAG: STAS domain-containing protein [Pseudomonadota bacterium]